MSLPFGESGPVSEDMKPILIGPFCASDRTIPIATTNVRAVMTINPLRIRILLSGFSFRWTIPSQSGEPLQSCYDGSQIFAASSGHSGGRSELLRDARQGQRHFETPPLLQHELKVLYEQIDFHLRVEAMTCHEWPANIDHLRRAGTLFKNFNQHRRC